MLYIFLLLCSLVASWVDCENHHGKNLCFGVSNDEGDKSRCIYDFSELSCKNCNYYNINQNKDCYCAGYETAAKCNKVCECNWSGGSCGVRAAMVSPPAGCKSLNNMKWDEEEPNDRFADVHNCGYVSKEECDGRKFTVEGDVCLWHAGMDARCKAGNPENFNDICHQFEGSDPRCTESCECQKATGIGATGCEKRGVFKKSNCKSVALNIGAPDNGVSDASGSGSQSTPVLQKPNQPKKKESFMDTLMANKVWVVIIVACFSISLIAVCSNICCCRKRGVNVVDYDNLELDEDYYSIHNIEQRMVV